MAAKRQVKGAIAQLGERLPCTQEVGGSIPPSSTNSPSLNEASGLCALAHYAETLVQSEQIGAKKFQEMSYLNDLWIIQIWH
jgi:hypothetical protein